MLNSLKKKTEKKTLQFNRGAIFETNSKQLNAKKNVFSILYKKYAEHCQTENNAKYLPIQIDITSNSNGTLVELHNRDNN